MILSSFASAPLQLRLPVDGHARSLLGDTLDTVSAKDAYAALPVSGDEVNVQLEPNSVVALELG